jgi:hypothetical protein
MYSRMVRRRDDRGWRMGDELGELRHPESEIVTIHLSPTIHELHSEWAGARSTSRSKVRDMCAGVSSRWAHLKQADCHRTVRLIIEIFFEN